MAQICSLMLYPCGPSTLERPCDRRWQNPRMFQRADMRRDEQPGTFESFNHMSFGRLSLYVYKYIYLFCVWYLICVLSYKIDVLHCRSRLPRSCGSWRSWRFRIIRCETADKWMICRSEAVQILLIMIIIINFIFIIIIFICITMMMMIIIIINASNSIDMYTYTNYVVLLYSWFTSWWCFVLVLRHRKWRNWKRTLHWRRRLRFTIRLGVARSKTYLCNQCTHSVSLGAGFCPVKWWNMTCQFDHSEHSWCGIQWPTWHVCLMLSGTSWNAWAGSEGWWMCKLKALESFWYVILCIYHKNTICLDKTRDLVAEVIPHVSNLFPSTLSCFLRGKEGRATIDQNGRGASLMCRNFCFPSPAGLRMLQVFESWKSLNDLSCVAQEDVLACFPAMGCLNSKLGVVKNRWTV